VGRAGPASKAGREWDGGGSMRINSILRFAAAAAPMMLTAGPALAAPFNLGFEDATLADWVGNGGTAFVTPALGAYTAQDGVIFGAVQAGQGEDAFTTLSRSFTLKAGGTISGYAGFLANDYIPFNDSAYVKVNDVNLLYWDVAAVGDFGSSGWTSFNFVAPTDGLYTLQLGVANHGDNELDSQAVIDAVRVTGMVPEAATWSMMVLGFGFAGAALRTRKRAISFG